MKSSRASRLYYSRNSFLVLYGKMNRKYQSQVFWLESKAFLFILNMITEAVSEPNLLLTSS